MNGNGRLLERLASSEIFQNYESAFTETTGLPLALRGVETWQLPLHGKRNENPFCALMAGTSKTCAACLQMQETLAKSASNAPATITCRYGLSETAVPIKLGGETIGFLQTGQVLDRKPTSASCNRAIAKARELGVELDKERAEEAWFKTPVVPPKKLESTSKLLAIFAKQLSTKSNEIAIRQANAELPVITRAKKYIEEHHCEDLSLGGVAKAMNMSLFYFCKLFKKATGLSFTEFVSRTRVEKAKNLLLNKNLRVSEIAYEVGFQSLTHFNRVSVKSLASPPPITASICHSREVTGPFGLIWRYETAVHMQPKMLPLHSTSSHAAIERRARAIFHTLGQPLGCELDYWIQAEEEFMRWVACRNEQRRPSRAGVRFVLGDVRS